MNVSLIPYALCRYYYQYRAERLTTCRITVHALLHLVDDIKRTGPVWVNWSFVMERFCGLLLPAIKSKRKPYACLNKRLLQVSQLAQITARYQLSNVLGIDKAPQTLSTHEEVLHDCKHFFRVIHHNVFTTLDPDLFLGWPKQARCRLEPEFQRKLGVFFSTLFNKPLTLVKKHIPEEVMRWGKVRIGDDGDSIRGKKVLPSDARNNSFIKVCGSVIQYIFSDPIRSNSIHSL